MRSLGQRRVDAAGRGSLELANVGKLAMSRILHGAADLHYRLQGKTSLV